MVVALLILPYVIAHGKFSPWQPATIDLQVYVAAVKDMLDGKDIYLTTTSSWHLRDFPQLPGLGERRVDLLFLYFIYPPIAAVLMVPLAFGPYVMWQVIWTGGLIWAQQSVLHRCGAPRGWQLGLLGVAVVLAVEPIRTTLGYGQVNTLLMALVVADLLPDAPSGQSPGLRSGSERRRIPQGTLIGLAAAIKLTPALFVIFAFLIGKKRAALTGIISFGVFTVVGTIFLFRETLEFWGGLSGGDTRTASPLYAGNQSLLGVFFRLGGSSATTTLVGLAVSGVLAVLATLVAARWWRAGQNAFAIGLVGLATCLASPLSWTHHYVWVLPMAVAVVLPTAAPVRLASGARQELPRWVRVLAGFWVLWVCACLPLAVLPYGGGRERNFSLLQDVVANLGPLLGVALVVGLAWQLVSGSRSSVLERAPAA